MSVQTNPLTVGGNQLTVGGNCCSNSKLVDFLKMGAMAVPMSMWPWTTTTTPLL